MHVFALGIPIFVFLKRKQLANRWSILLAGFVLGSIPISLMFLPNAIEGGSFDFSGPFVFGLFGAFSAWVFWVVLGRLNPYNSLGT